MSVNTDDLFARPMLPEAVRFERIDDTRDKFCQLAKRWNNRLVLEGFSLSEAYAKGRIAILLVMQCCFRSRLGFSRIANDAVNSTQTGEHEDCSGRGGRRVIFLILADADNHVVVFRDGRDQESMLVHSVKLVQRQELVSSLLRCYDISNYRSESGIGSLYHSVFTGSYKVFPRLIEREISAGRVVFPARNNYGTGEQVQGCAEIVNSVADNQRDFVGKSRFVSYADCMALASRSVILVGACGINIKLDDSIEPCFKLLDVLVGPFNL